MINDSLRRGEWTTGSEWAGLVCIDSSPRYLWEWLVAEELWGTGRHAEQPPTDAPPHDTHISDALNRITMGTRHDHNKQNERQQQHPRCHKTSSSTFCKLIRHSIKSHIFQRLISKDVWVYNTNINYIRDRCNIWKYYIEYTVFCTHTRPWLIIHSVV